MRKTLYLLLSTFMIFCLFGCAQEEYVLVLGDGLPDYVYNVEYIEYEFDDGFVDEELTKGYLFNDGSRLLIYEWKNVDNKDYDEITVEQMKKYFPDSKLEYIVLDSWDEPNDFTYGYFMSYIPVGYDNPYYTQNYYFINGDKVTQLQFWLPGKRVGIPGTNYTIDLPLGYENGTLDRDELNDDAIAMFVPIFEEEYPELNVYYWENEFDTYEEFAKEELSVRYDMKTYSVIDYVDIYGNNQNALFSIYDEDDEGTLETNYDITINLGDYNIAFDFFVLIDDEYIRYSVPAIVSSIGLKK